MTAGRDLSTHIGDSHTQSTVNNYYDSTGSPFLPPSETGPVVVGAVPRPARHFVKRAQIGSLRQVLIREQVVVMVCERGTGKTQIAAAYAREVMEDESAGLVGWVHAETRDSALAGLAEIATKMGVADPEGDSLISSRRLRDHLNSTRELSGVLVFDKASDPNFLSEFLPAGGGMRVVITSTDHNFVSLGEMIEAAPRFTRAESIGYLEAATGLGDPEGANALAADVGDGPMALAAAAVAITSQRLDYQGYRKLVAARPSSAELRGSGTGQRSVDRELGLTADAAHERTTDERGRWSQPSTQDFFVRWQYPGLGILEFTDEQTAVTWIREFGDPHGKS